MTTAHGHHALSHATTRLDPRPVVAPAIRVAWTVSVEALRAARPDLTIDPRARDATLTWTIAPGGDATAALEVDAMPINFPLVPAALGADATIDAPTRTLQVRVPGLLDLVLDHDPASDAAGINPAILYARTSLLAAIGLPGGSYRLTQPRAAQ